MHITKWKCSTTGVKSVTEVIKLFSSSTQLSMALFLHINVKNANNCWHLHIHNQESIILGFSEPEKY